MKEGIISAASKITDIVFCEVFMDQPFTERDARIYPAMDTILNRMEEVREKLIRHEQEFVPVLAKEVLSAYIELMDALGKPKTEEEIEQLTLLLSFEEVFKSEATNILVDSTVSFLRYYEDYLGRATKDKVKHYTKQIELNFLRLISEEKQEVGV